MKCSFDDCQEEALFSYVWAWGESGVCCERHRFILGQQSARLARGVTVTPLEPGAPKPVTRDERIACHAQILALEAEIQEVQAQVLTLHESTVELGRQNRTMVAQKAVLESELQLHRQRVDELSQKLITAQQDRAKAQAEIQRLERRLAAYALPDVPPLDSEDQDAHTR